MYDFAKSLGFGVRNEAKAMNNTNDADWRCLVGGIQTAKAATSIFAEVNKYDMAARTAVNIANNMSKAVNPLLCVAALARVASEKDKPSALIEESCAMGAMFAVEGVMKSQFKEGSFLAETQAVKNCVNKLDDFCRSTRVLKNVKGGTLGSLLTGLAFIGGSILSFSAGENVGKNIADCTTRRQKAFVPVEA